MVLVKSEKVHHITTQLSHCQAVTTSTRQPSRMYDNIIIRNILHSCYTLQDKLNLKIVHYLIFVSEAIS